MSGEAYASWPSGLATRAARARRLKGSMQRPPRRETRPASNRVAVVALGAALGLGFAGRVAVHAGSSLPHGDAVVALGRVAVALGAPWLAAAWAVGVLAGSR